MSRAIPGYTINTLTAGDFTNLSIFEQSDGSGGTVLLCSGSYKVKTTPADTPNPDQNFTSVTVTLTPAQVNAIRTFITNNLVGPANAQEGL